MYSSWSRHSIVLLVFICLIIAAAAAIEEMAEENQPINLPSEGQQEPEVDLTPLPRSYGALFGSATPEKRSWPELEGLTAEEAEKKIKEEMPMAAVHVVPHGNFVTMDFRTNRVRIFVDSSNKVVRAPMVG